MGQFLDIPFIVRQEFMQRRVQGTNGHRLPLMTLKRPLKSSFCMGRSFASARSVPRGPLPGSFRERHRSDCLEKHVLSPRQPDPFRSESNGFLSLVGLVRIGPNLEAAEFIRPAEQRHIVLIHLGPLRRQTLIDQDPEDLRRARRDLPGEDLPCRTVQ